MYDKKGIPIIGLRTIKTIIAVALAALCMEYIFNDTPFFACIGAVVAMERTMATSIKMSVIRNVGTVTGGVTGVCTTLLTDNIVLLTLGLVPMIYINNRIGKKESIIPGSIVYFAVVYLNTTAGAFQYGMRRILGTLLGTFIGIAVNYLVCRPKNEEIY